MWCLRRDLGGKGCDRTETPSKGVEGDPRRPGTGPGLWTKSHHSLGPGVRGAAEPEWREHCLHHRSPGSSCSSPQRMWPPPQTTRRSEQLGSWVGFLATAPLSLAPSSPRSSRPQRLPLSLIYSWTGGSSASEPVARGQSQGGSWY